MNNPIKVVITDRYTLSAKSLAALLSNYHQLQLLGDVRTCDDLFAFLNKSRADVALVDLHDFQLSNLRLCRKITECFPTTRLVAVSGNQVRRAKELEDYGINTCLFKDMDPNSFVSAIFRIVAREDIGNNTNLPKMSSYKIMIDKYKVSPRELEVISLMGKGLTSPEIADKLFVSLNTIKHHRKNILQKLEMKNVQEVVAFSIKYNLC